VDTVTLPMDFAQPPVRLPGDTLYHIA